MSSKTPIHYREGDQSIIVCESAESGLELVAGENISGIVRRSDYNYHMLGIWLKDIDSSVWMVSIGGNNTDLHLDFVGMGHYCYAVSCGRYICCKSQIFRAIIALKIIFGQTTLYRIVINIAHVFSRI